MKSYYWMKADRHQIFDSYKDPKKILRYQPYYHGRKEGWVAKILAEKIPVIIQPIDKFQFIQSEHQTG